MRLVYVATLSSSSTKGNAYLAWDDGTRPVLIDCGISLRRLVGGLAQLGMEPRDLAGLFITHEHIDHISAMCLVTPVAEKFGIPVYSSPGFWSWYRCKVGRHIDPSLINVIEANQSVSAGGMSVRAFAKPHDACEPLAFAVESQGERAAFVMDLGHVPDALQEGIAGSDYFVFESNHDVEMEKNSGRPIYLIRRVLGKLGHLSNDQAGRCLADLVTANTRKVVLAHLSLDCNTPEIAVAAVSERLQKVGKLCRVLAAPAGDVAVF